MDCGYCRGIGDVQRVTGSDMPLCFVCRVERGQEKISMPDLVAYLNDRHLKSRGQVATTKSTTCVVVEGSAVDIDAAGARCGKPVVGERGDWPMCLEHYAMFDPEKTQLQETLEFYADPESYFAIAIWPDRPSGWFADDYGCCLMDDQHDHRHGRAARKALGDEWGGAEPCAEMLEHDAGRAALSPPEAPTDDRKDG